jgi:transposase
LVLESRASCPSEYEAIRSIAAKLGVVWPESLRGWVRQAEVDGGVRVVRTAEETAEIG